MNLHSDPKHSGEDSSARPLWPMSGETGQHLSPRGESPHKLALPAEPIALSGMPALPLAAKAPAVRSPDGPATTHDYLSMFLQEMPPAPASVRLTLSDAGGAQMSREFYRCLARELGGLGIDDLVLSQPAGAAACTWLGDAVGFAKGACHIPHVSLRSDFFSLTEDALARALAAGLDCLAVELDWGNPRWRHQAEQELKAHPGSFENRLHRLLLRRDESTAHAHKCLFKLLLTGDMPPEHALAPMVEQLAEMCDLYAIERPGTVLSDPADCQASAALCWGPFTEAVIDAQGHLLACGHDRSGASFVADLKTVEFMQAWHGVALQETRRAQLTGGQRACLCAHCPGKRT